MNRYQDIKQSETTTGKKYYVTTRYPQIPFSNSDIYVVATQNDRLDMLAAQFYGDQTLYWVIAIANNNFKKNSLFVPEGTQLRIPLDITNIITSYNLLNGL